MILRDCPVYPTPPPAPPRIRGGETDKCVCVGTRHASSSFAKTTVTIRLIRDESSSLRIVIHDDGAGFAPQILSRLGEPYISTRLESGKNMGLGVFIAQTLLEDTGATLSYDNKLSGGALVTIEWPLDGQGNLLFTLAP